MGFQPQDSGILEYLVSFHECQGFLFGGAVSFEESGFAEFAFADLVSFFGTGYFIFVVVDCLTQVFQILDPN